MMFLFCISLKLCMKKKCHLGREDNQKEEENIRIPGSLMSFCMFYDSATNWTEVTATRSLSILRLCFSHPAVLLLTYPQSLSHFPYRLLFLPRPPPLSLLIFLSVGTSVHPSPYFCESLRPLSLSADWFHWSSSPPCSPSSSFLTFFSPFLKLLLPSLASLRLPSHPFSSFHFISERLPLGARPSRNPKPKSLYLYLSLTNTHSHTNTCLFLCLRTLFLYHRKAFPFSGDLGREFQHVACALSLVLRLHNTHLI